MAKTYGCRPSDLLAPEWGELERYIVDYECAVTGVEEDRKALSRAEREVAMSKARR